MSTVALADEPDDAAKGRGLVTLVLPLPAQVGRAPLAQATRPPRSLYPSLPARTTFCSLRGLRASLDLLHRALARSTPPCSASLEFLARTAHACTPHAAHRTPHTARTTPCTTHCTSHHMHMHTPAPAPPAPAPPHPLHVRAQHDLPQHPQRALPQRARRPARRPAAPPQARPPTWDPTIRPVARFEGRAAEGYQSRSVSPKAWWIRLRSVSRA